MTQGSPQNRPQGDKRPKKLCVSRLSVQQEEFNKCLMNLGRTGCPLIAGRSQGTQEAPWDLVPCRCMYVHRREYDTPGYSVAGDSKPWVVSRVSVGGWKLRATLLHRLLERRNMLTVKVLREAC